VSQQFRQSFHYLTSRKCGRVGAGGDSTSGLVVGLDTGKRCVAKAISLGPDSILYQDVDGWDTAGLLAIDGGKRQLAHRIDAIKSPAASLST
jgi:hypothetical protein